VYVGCVGGWEREFYAQKMHGSRDEAGCEWFPDDGNEAMSWKI
jgi:hypothetical protein